MLFFAWGDYFSEVEYLVVHEEDVGCTRGDTRGDTRRWEGHGHCDSELGNLMLSQLVAPSAPRKSLVKPEADSKTLWSWSSRYWYQSNNTWSANQEDPSTQESKRH